MELADHPYISFVEAKMEILRTRRDFVKGIAIGILGATALSLLNPFKTSAGKNSSPKAKGLKGASSLFQPRITP
jgi:hypothetical protein|tara:strand:+ start:378 stop:599 length:222 start_codon:yes stop_codon:yes gene_type:complete